MKQKIKSCLLIMCTLIAVSLCFVGCDFKFGGSGGGSTDDDTSTTAQVTGIDLAGDIKTKYYIGDELDLNGARLKVVYDDDTEKNVTLMASMVTGFDSSKLGNYSLTITYKNKSIKKNYTVSADGDYVADYSYGTYYYKSEDDTNPTIVAYSGTYTDTKAKWEVSYTLKIDGLSASMRLVRKETSVSGKTEIIFDVTGTASLTQTENILTSGQLLNDKTQESANTTLIITVYKDYLEMIQRSNKNNDAGAYELCRFLRVEA